MTRFCRCVQVLPFITALSQLCISPLWGQSEGTNQVRLDALATVDRVSLYGGDATVGGYSGWGLTGGLALRSRSPFGAEAFFAFSPKDEDPYTPSPRFLIPGGWVTISFSGDPTAKADVFLGLGAAFVNTAGAPDHSGCQPPECFAEGGPDFRNGNDLVFIWGGGVSYHLPGLLSFRLAVRVPSGEPRVGAGVGVRVR